MDELDESLEETSMQVAAADIPENGVVIMIDDQRFGYYQLGDLSEQTAQTGMAIYRLVSYFSGNSQKIARAVDGIVGRLN